MEFRSFGQTGMKLSAVGLGGLLAHYWEGADGHPPADVKRRIYLRAAELGSICSTWVMEMRSISPKS